MRLTYWDEFKGDLPYRVCLVRLREGPLLVSNLMGTAENPRIGAPVKVVSDAVSDAVTLLKFVLV